MAAGLIMMAVLALDQGTTLSRAIIFDANMRVAASPSRSFRSISRNPAGSSMIRGSLEVNGRDRTGVIAQIGGAGEDRYYRHHQSA